MVRPEDRVEEMGLVGPQWECGKRGEVMSIWNVAVVLCVTLKAYCDEADSIDTTLVRFVQSLHSRAWSCLSPVWRGQEGLG